MEATLEPACKVTGVVLVLPKVIKLPEVPFKFNLFTVMVKPPVNKMVAGLTVLVNEPVPAKSEKFNDPVPEPVVTVSAPAPS